ncbi:unnamed protein product [Caenorhabditis angaria]|uniref:Uncharacterized protein n=1 Tax=Caenorhabditis angaria TaxID=860376 RepID=A0A9P1IUU9_9PELO|nr:unnamed protein product [Caenorhabditis angaria]
MNEKLFILVLLALSIELCQTQCYGQKCKEGTRQYLEDTEQCHGMECESKESLLKMISKMQKSKHEQYMAPALKKPLAISQMFVSNVVTAQNYTCSICDNPALCLNGGTCVADPTDPWKYYHCICPDNTSGENCQNIIECKTNTCGANAICYVSNHQLNCICKPGYTARGNGRDCDLKVQRACMHGDPHYETFDNLRFDYQGTCPYVFSQPCSQLPSPFKWYSVRAKNELPGKGYHVSSVSEVEVDFDQLTIHVDGRSKTALVNGVQVLLPWYYPTKSNWTVYVGFSGTVFTLKNDQGVSVIFNTFTSLCVQVPDIPAFQNTTTLCGLAGNIDGKWSDDVVNKNGTVLPISNNHQPESQNRQDFMATEDSWITDNFLVLRPNQEICINGQTIDNNTKCDVSSASTYCYPILQAELGVGPFGGCQGLGNETLDNFYYDCVYDVCRNPSFKCTALSNFFHYCQTNLPTTAQDPNWRNEVDCELACQPNSHYSLCTSACPSTCAEPYPENCYEPCSDGCECDQGYVIDNTVTRVQSCIRIDQCGCVDENGNPHSANVPWLTNNCTIYHICQNGSMYSDYRPCSTDGYCADIGYGYSCECQKGYRGDGYTCNDINECVETPGICGHGTCKNLPGTYQCICDKFYAGTNCTDFKPRRDCADLYVYWGIRQSGQYEILPPFATPNLPAFTPFSVQCDMSNDGGYTLVSSDIAGLNINKTYQQYVNGFGNSSTQNLFIGLEYLYQSTQYVPQTLRLELFRCSSNNRPSKTTECIYPSFQVLNATTQYSVVIPKPCSGSEAGDNYYEDGWARWDLNGKITINDAVYSSCSEANLRTGWWYVEDQLCGAANLNGVRYDCANIPIETQRYLRWAQGTLGQSWMYLRPASYPSLPTDV